MQNRDDDFWGEPIFSYSRAQAIADGVLVDLTNATDDHGQLLCRQAGFKIPVAVTRAAWAKTIEAGGTWRSENDGEVLELEGGQSLTGRLWTCCGCCTWRVAGLQALTACISSCWWTCMAMADMSW
jgi:hypothetical protein